MTVTFYTSENYTSYRVEGEHEVVARKIIDSKLSFRPNGYFFSPKFKQGVWDGYIRLDSHEGFPTGLLPSITRELEAEGVEYQLEDSIIPVGLPELPDKIQLYHEKLPNNELYLRDYQYDAVVKTLEKRRGIVHAATNAGKCLTKDTNILTTNGYKTIEQIFSENGTPVENKEDVVEAKDVMLVNRYGEAERATHLTFNGEREVTRVQADDGTVIRATSNHPLLIIDENAELEWREVGNLKVGDYLVQRLGEGACSTPASYAERLEAYCLGMLIADGYLNMDYKVGFTNDEPVLHDLMREFYKTLSDKEPGFRHRHEGRDSASLSLHSKKATKLFHDRYKIPYSTSVGKEVPEMIMNGSRELQAEFLSGYLECECDISRNRGNLCVGSVSYKLIHQVKLLLNNFGIYCKVSKRPEPKKSTHNQSYRITVARGEFVKLSEVITFRTDYRQRSLSEALANYEAKQHKRQPKEQIPFCKPVLNAWRDSYPGPPTGFRKATGVWADRPVHKKKVRDFLSEYPLGNVELREKLTLLSADNLRFIEIVQIESDGVEETFDVHLPETHSFIANGIVNHNTEIACGIMKYVAPTLISDMDENIIFFTHSIEIATQSKKRIEERLQRKVGFVGKGEWDVQEITVVLIPTISRHLKPPSKSKITYTKEMKSIKTVVDLASGAILKRDDSNLKTMQTISEVLNSVDSEANFDAKAVEIATQIATESQTSLEVYERVKELKEALKEYERAKLGKSLEKHEAVMSLLENCRCFIADEAHHSSSTTWYDTFMLMENAEFRIGLTGTVDEKDDPVNLAKLRGATGETIIEISNDFLIRKGYSAKPTIYLETIDKPENMVAHNYQDAYATGIVDNVYRNEVIARRVKDRVRSEKSCLVIVNQTKHGEYLEKRLKELDVDCEFIHGSRSNEDRQSALDNLADGTLSVLIATTILDEGVDVSGINCVWMAGGGKSYKKVLQRVGRGLRKKEDGSGLEVYDFLDYTNNYLTRHTLDRYDYYRDEKFEIVKTDRIM